METGTHQHFNEAQRLLEEIRQQKINSAEELEQFRIKYLGSKGKIKDLFAVMKEVPAEERKNFGQLLNTVKELAEGKFETVKQQLASSAEKPQEPLDLTRP